MDNQISGDSITYSISDFECIKIKVLNWANQFGTFCFLDNHLYQTSHHSIECVLAAGINRKVETSSLEELQQLINEKKSWLFGHLSYDLKNDIEEGLHSVKSDDIGFPNLFFFEPIYRLQLSSTQITIDGPDAKQVWEAINNGECAEVAASNPLQINSRLDKEAYLRIINQLQQHIQRGDCYEINYCQEFFAHDASIHPVTVYQKLSEVSPNPFSALYRIDDKWLLCASPERFLRKEGKAILSQPIKGTAKRIKTDNQQDEESKHQLENSEKDKSENVMVVDLVRNDLSKVCKEGSVKVDELFGVYAFPQVYQMISTVSGELASDNNFTDIIKATFPMGSMTGAPKRRVMELIEQYEKSRRGIFSGAVGYISPEGDFDFNVVIRSIMYNAENRYVSFQAGSGITFYSDAEKEWEECLLKAEAMKRVLTLDRV